VTLPELCIRRPVMTTLLMLTTVIVGLFGYRLLPVAALPSVDFPTISVSASLPGASPETMASAVATPLERQFETIPGIDSIISTSTLGTTQITLQFSLSRNVDGAALDVQSAISTAARQLPPEMVTPPSFRKVNPAQQPIIFLSLNSATLPLTQVDEYAETLISPRISTLAGVAQVNVYGQQKYAVRIEADPHALNAAGMSLTQLGDAIASANSNTPVGVIDGPRNSLTLEASGQLQKAADYRDLIVAYKNGQPVRLRDVAQAVDSVQDTRIASWFNGTRSVCSRSSASPTPTPCRWWTRSASWCRRCGRRSRPR
jgi:Cation/multidrug efflux pump